MSVLTAPAITKYYSQGTPAGITPDVWTLISGALLDQQPEQVTVSFENMSTDDISKLWSVLGEKYRPSAAYVVTVVLLQPRGRARRAAGDTTCRVAGQLCCNPSWPASHRNGSRGRRHAHLVGGESVGQQHTSGVRHHSTAAPTSTA
jgi:hypothetical protein